MFDLKRRLEHASNACNPREYVENEQHKVGREAEKSFATTLQRDGGLSALSIFYGLRVPDEYQSRKHEIDIVLLHSTGIYPIEIKNWVGTVRVSRDKGFWIQSKFKKSDCGKGSFSQEVEHENALKCLRRKSRLLRDHLFRLDVSIPKTCFKPKLIFVNQNLDIDPEIAAENEVILPQGCQDFVGSFYRGYFQSVVDSLVPGLITGMMSYGTIKATTDALGLIGTWDVIQLNGGKHLYGDFKECPYFSVDRKNTDCLEFSHRRSRLTSTTLALLGYSPSTTVSFRQRGGNGWLWNTYRAVVNIPYDTELKFRICGDEVDSMIIANDIERIFISV